MKVDEDPRAVHGADLGNDIRRIVLLATSNSTHSDQIVCAFASTFITS